MTPKEKQEEILSEDEFCHYSGLPSPSAYQSEENKEKENKLK